MTRRAPRPPYQVEVRWQPGPRTAEYEAIWRWLMRGPLLDGEPGRPDAPCRQQHVEPTPGAQIQDPVAGTQLSHGGGVAAAQTGGDGVERQVLKVGER